MDSILSSGKSSTSVADVKTYSQIEFRLKESEKINQALLENSPVCTKIIDTDLNLQYMSNAGVKALKIKDVSKFYGKPYPLSYYSDSFKKPMAEGLKMVITTGEAFENEAPILDADGKEIWFHSIMVPIKSDNRSLDYILVVSVDITDRIEALNELREYHINLESIVEERTKELEEKNRDLERFNKLFQGREFRIKELRDQVKELKLKLDLK